MKIIFFGSSDFSLHALQACLKKPHEVILIITTPPQKKGRGLIETPTPVQVLAETNKIPFLAPENLKSPELLNQIQMLKPEFFVVSSYGKMIPSAWLKVPSRYALNVHPSLLPKYRGAAPIHWPIILGDTVTGVSIAEVTPALDAGDIFYQIQTPITENTDAVLMTDSLGKLSQEALQTVLRTAQTGELKRTPQDHSLWNYARKLRKEDGNMDWTRTALQIANQIRGLLPWPIVSMQNGDDSIQILKASANSEKNTQQHPGEIVSILKDVIEVQTGKGILILEKLRPAGKKEMSAGDFARGRRLTPGHSFPSSPQPPHLALTQSIN